jgi:hypothetical protein
MPTTPRRTPDARAPSFARPARSSQLGSTRRRRTGLAVLVAAIGAALSSAAALLCLGRWEDALRFVVVAVAMCAPLVGDVPVVFVSAFAAFVLLATWAAVQHWYRTVDHLDVLVHLVTPGSLAAVVYFALASHHLLPGIGVARHRPAVVLAMTLVGTAVAVVWELYEWAMNEVSPRYMLVGSDDTLGDLLAGMVGSVLAGVLVLRWLDRRSVSARWSAPLVTAPR